MNAKEALEELKYKRFYSNGVGVDLIDSYLELFNCIDQALEELEEKNTLLNAYKKLSQSSFFTLGQFLHCIGFSTTKFILVFKNGREKLVDRTELTKKELNTIVLNIFPNIRYNDKNILIIHLNNVGQGNWLEKSIKTLEGED